MLTQSSAPTRGACRACAAPAGREFTSRRQRRASSAPLRIAAAPAVRSPSSPSEREAFAAAVAADLRSLPADGDLSAVARRGLRFAPVFALNSALRKLPWADSLRLLRWMEAQSGGERANEHSYASFLAVCGPGPSLSQARQLWRRLTNGGTLPGSRVCVALLGVLGRAGEVGEAVELWQRMGWEELPRDAHSLNAVLSACAASGAWSAAMQVWRQQTSRECDQASQPDAFSLALLLNACDRGGQWSRGLEVAMSPQGRRIALDAAGYGALMTVAGRAGETRVVQDTWARLIHERRVPLTTWLFNAHMGALAAVGDAPRAQALMNDMSVAGVAPDVRSFTALMEAHARQNALEPEARLASVRRTLAQLLQAGLSPTETTLTVFVTALGDAQRWREAEQTATEWDRVHGLRRNTVTFNALMRACLRAGQPQEALRLFRDMQAASLMPSSATFVMLLAGCEETGLKDVAAELRALRGSLTTTELLRDALQPVEDEEPTKPEESFAPGAWWQPEAPQRRGRVQRKR